MKLKRVPIIIILAIASFWFFRNETVSSDFPIELHEKIDTIEVTYIAWACECANWLPDEHFNVDRDKLAEATEEYCIFIEADREEIKIPEEYYLGGTDNRIRLIGSYYKEKGISRDPEYAYKPEKAKVFRYSDIEIIKPYSIWDFKDKDDVGGAKIKVITKEMKAFNE